VCWHRGDQSTSLPNLTTIFDSFWSSDPPQFTEDLLFFLVQNRTLVLMGAGLGDDSPSINSLSILDDRAD
jgi:hypothetical protein